MAPHPPPGTPTAVKVVLAALVTVACVAIVYVVLWFYMAASYRDAIDEWAEARRSEGACRGPPRDGRGTLPLR